MEVRKVFKNEQSFVVAVLLDHRLVFAAEVSCLEKFFSVKKFCICQLEKLLEKQKQRFRTSFKVSSVFLAALPHGLRKIRCCLDI